MKAEEVCLIVNLLGAVGYPFRTAGDAERILPEVGADGDDGVSAPGVKRERGLVSRYAIDDFFAGGTLLLA